MTDQRKTPPFGRARTAPPDRDEFVPKHRTSPHGVVLTPYTDQDDVTGQYQGEELDAARARRPTPDRVARLERKNDELIAGYVALLKEANSRAQARDDEDRRVAREIEQAEAKDKLAARKYRRKIFGVGLAFGMGVLEIVHQVLALVHK